MFCSTSSCRGSSFSLPFQDHHNKELQVLAHRGVMNFLRSLHSVGEPRWCLSSTSGAFPSAQLGVGEEPLAAAASRIGCSLFPWILLWSGCNLPNCNLLISFPHLAYSHGHIIIQSMLGIYQIPFFPSFSHTCNVSVLPGLISLGCSCMRQGGAGGMDASNQTLFPSAMRLIIYNLL